MPEWISVEDRFPELEKEVLIYGEWKEEAFKGENVIAISSRYLWRWYGNSSGYEIWREPWAYFNRNYKITHWMPLPEFPCITLSCDLCRGAIHTAAPFKVITHRGREVECEFNFCPKCGRKLPAESNKVNKI